MFRENQIRIFACDMLGDLRKFDPDLLAASMSPNSLIEWAFVEVSSKINRVVLQSDTHEIIQALAKIAKFFDLPKLDFPSVHIQYWEYVLPPTVDIRGNALVITPPDSTVGGRLITPESVKIFKVNPDSIVEVGEYFVKSSPGQIQHIVGAGVYCVVAYNINGYGIPARNVEVK